HELRPASTPDAHQIWHRRFPRIPPAGDPGAMSICFRPGSMRTVTIVAEQSPYAASGLLTAHTGVTSPLFVSLLVRSPTVTSAAGRQGGAYLGTGGLTLGTGGHALRRPAVGRPASRL